MRKSTLPLALLVLVLGVAYSISGTQRVRGRLGDLDRISSEFQTSVDGASARVLAAADTGRQMLIAEIQDSLRVAARSVAREELAAYQTRLDSVTTALAETQLALQSAREEKDRLDRSLPERVSLDDLDRRYSEKLRSSSGGGLSYSHGVTLERFETSRGTITFHVPDLTMVRVPSTQRLAYLRIGKQKDSMKSAELIRAWLDEAAEERLALGYTRVSNRTRPAEYGEVTERLYQKGDGYLKTYFQYERVLETYGRHSLRYTYYIEVGSTERVEQYEREEYAAKLGT